MPYDLFWHGDPMFYYLYLDAYNKKIKDENEIFINQENYKAWLQGIYVKKAIECNNPLIKTKVEYPEKPLSFDSKEENKSEDKDKKIAEDTAKFLAFEKYVEAFNKNFKENGK